MKIRYGLELTIGTAPKSYQFVKPSMEVEVENDNFQVGLAEAKKLVKEAMREEIALILKVFPNATLVTVP